MNFMDLRNAAQRAPAKSIGLVAYIVLAALMVTFGNPLA
jgi:hypothetical protein